MARRLLAAGHRVTVWNRTPARAAALAAAGAEVAATPADAAGADVVITMLTDAAAVEAALFEADGAAGSLRAGAVVVQMSTIGPDEVRAIAARLPGDVSFLDAPVAGSVGAVEAGTLTMFVGGSDEAAALADSVLRELGTIRRSGQVGTAAALKLVVNTAMVSALGALRDTLAVAESVGVDRAVAVDVLATGPLAGAVQRATATGASFAISLAAKDARLALRDTPEAPVLAAVAELLRAAPDQDADIAAVINPDNALTKERS
jgi:3-hydroxyisobutyrate dehydrogenase